VFWNGGRFVEGNGLGTEMGLWIVMGLESEFCLGREKVLWREIAPNPSPSPNPSPFPNHLHPQPISLRNPPARGKGEVKG